MKPGAIWWFFGWLNMTGGVIHAARGNVGQATLSVGAGTFFMAAAIYAALRHHAADATQGDR